MAVRDFTTDALVIRELPSGEHDRLLTLLSAEYGRLPVIAKGARSLKNKLLSPTRPFVYGNYELHRKGDFIWMRDASCTEPFTALTKDIEKLYLAQYIADVCYDLSGEDVPAGDILRLALNSYYALSRGLRDIRLIKGVFELRAAADSGYMPELSVCASCGCKAAPAWYLDVMNGALLCSSCVAGRQGNPTLAAEGLPDYNGGTGNRTILLHLSAPVLAAMRYVVSAPAGRVLSFELKDGDDAEDFSHAAETYLLNHLERGFSSLKLYHEVRKI